MKDVYLHRILNLISYKDTYVKHYYEKNLIYHFFNQDRFKQKKGKIEYNGKEAYLCNHFKEACFKDNVKLDFSTYLPLLLPMVEVNKLPPFSFHINLEITLEKPLISKDDDLFYFLENSMRKEWTTKMPILAASTWKGLLHWVGVKHLLEKIFFIQSLGIQEKNQVVQLRLNLLELFGSENDNTREYLDWIFTVYDCQELYVNYLKELLPSHEIKDSVVELRGKLNFYPSYFKRLTYDVINPLKSEFLTGTQPIVMEMVPAGEKANFDLVYIPLVNSDQMKRDLNLILKFLSRLFFDYGISAKRSSRYGLISTARGKVILKEEEQKLQIITSQLKDQKELVLGGEKN